MQGRIKVLKDVDKSNILPMTHAKAVYVDEKNTLDKTLDDIKKGTVKVIDATGAELKALVDAEKLIPGSYYRYTDWRVEMKDSDSETGVKILDPYTGETEPLILLAMTNKDFYPLVRSELHPTDIIYFRFNGKYQTDHSTKWGYITRRIDTVNQISLPSDWRNVKVKLYKPKQTLYYTFNNASEGNPYEEVLPTIFHDESIYIAEGKFYLYSNENGTRMLMKGIVNTNQAVKPILNAHWVYALNYFDDVKSFESGGERGREIGYTIEGITSPLKTVYLRMDKQNPQWYPIVNGTCRKLYQEGYEGLTYNYYDTATDITLGGDSTRNVIFRATRIVLGSSNLNNVITSSDIHLEYNNSGNTLYGAFTRMGSNCNSNNIQTSCHNNKMRYSCSNNFFGGDSDYNSLGNACNGNQFDVYCDYNQLYHGSGNNIFRPNRASNYAFNSNTFNGPSSSNKIFGDFKNNIIDGLFSSNITYSNTLVYDNHFFEVCQSNRFKPTEGGAGTTSRGNKFGPYFTANIIEHDLSYCNLQKFTGNTLRNYGLEQLECMKLENKTFGISALSANGTKRIYQTNMGGYKYYYEYRNENNTVVSYEIP